MTSDEYRDTLYKKINALIVVLGESVKKLEKKIEGPSLMSAAEVERIEKIRDNLLNTIQICERAKATLVAQQAGEMGATPSTSGARQYTEMSSIEEYRKFKDMAPISPNEISDVDWDDLTDKLKGV